MPSPATTAHIEAERRIRVQTTQALAAIWRRLPGYDEQDVAEWLARALPVVLAGQRASVSITNAYLARVLGAPPAAVDLEQLTGAGVRNGVAPAEVYRRPFVTVWTSLQNGTPWTDAVAAGLARATATAAMDVQLAMRATAQDTMQRAGVTTYSRVPDGNACPLCVVASMNVYKTGDLMPIHNHCGCGVAPGGGERLSLFDAERILNERVGPDSPQWSANTFSMEQAIRRGEERADAARARAQEVKRELERETEPDRRRRLLDRQRSWSDRAAEQQRRVDLDRERLNGRRNPRVTDFEPEIRQHGEVGPVLTDARHEFTEL